MNIYYRLIHLLKDNRVRWLLLSAALIVFVAFYRAYSAGTIRVDQHGLSGIPVFIVFMGFIMGLGVYAFSLYSLWSSSDLDIADVRLLAVMLAAIFSFMLPMMSNDIYSLLTYGDAANRGVDVYTDTGGLHVSPYYDFVSYLWKTAPCVYGPISLGTSRLACMVAGGNILMAIAAYKVLVFLWGLLLIEAVYRIAKLMGNAVKPLMFIVLNPLFLLQGVAQLHCDMLAVSLACSMLYFFLKKDWYFAFLFAGFAIVAKINYVLLLPFLVVALFLEKDSWRSFLYRSLGGIWITAMVLMVMYFPYYTSKETFTKPLNFLFSQNPAKSIAEVMGDVVYFAPGVITGHTDEVNANINRPSGISDAQLAAWLFIKKACQLFALLLSAVIFLKFWFGERKNQRWMQVFLRCLAIFLLFYSHVFYAWYLMILLPFVWYETDKRFMQWLFVLTCFSNVHDILCAVNHGTAIYFTVLPLTFLSVLVFFWRFRNNFFRSLDYHRAHRGMEEYRENTEVR